jgi:hypothetical protein
MTPLPNTRVQRTRSSPSAPHSPLTRHPLGGFAQVSGVLLLSSLGSLIGCETIGGRLYWAGTGFAARVACETTAVSEKHLRVDVRDWMGLHLPGASVRVSQAGSVGMGYMTDERGIVDVPVVPGPWVVEVSLGGFYSGWRSVDVSDVGRCTVTFYLRLNDKGAVWVNGQAA